MKQIRTHLTHGLIAAIVLGIATGVVFAASVHFKNSQPVTATNNGSALTLTVCAGLSGLGNGDVTIRLTAVAAPTAVCINPSGNQEPPGQNPAQVSVSGATIIPSDQIKNGNVSFCVETSAPPQPTAAEAHCHSSAGWTARITHMTFCNYTITVEQGGNIVLGPQTFGFENCP